MRRLSCILSLSCLALLICLPLMLSAGTPAAQPHALLAPAPPAAALIDINTATADQLKTLPGIGREYAKRIIAGRPYSAKNQLLTRGIIPQGAYNRIADQIVARRVKK
ncbi:MAG TPA: helix-hairpin-helix domain-containing protein [Acidobacteriaceae bacterium]|jgi:DNA uptake protein ComE-like DNA-binding protein|nr:helix-hairpin-helix domain-containing protein [Acidobacteriaceae bacterium]